MASIVEALIGEVKRARGISHGDIRRRRGDDRREHAGVDVTCDGVLAGLLERVDVLLIRCRGHAEDSPPARSQGS